MIIKIGEFLMIRELFQKRGSITAISKRLDLTLLVNKLKSLGSHWQIQPLMMK